MHLSQIQPFVFVITAINVVTASYPYHYCCHHHHGSMSIHAGTVPIWGGMRHLGEGAKISVFSQDLAQVSPLFYHDNSQSFHTLQHSTIAATMLTMYASSHCSSFGKNLFTEMLVWRRALLPACVV